MVRPLRDILVDDEEEGGQASAEKRKQTCLNSLNCFFVGVATFCSVICL